MSRKPTEGDVLALLALLREEQVDDVASIMFDDLVWSARQLDPGFRSKVLVHAAAIFGSRGLRDEVAGEILKQLEDWPVLRGSVDFIVVTVKEPEFDGAKVAFDVDPRRDPDYSWRGAYFYDVELARPPGQRALKGVITKSGTDGNSSMSSFLHTVLSTYTARLCCLVGMAAGHSKQVTLGDVVFAEKVVDYGRRIVTESGEQQDGDTFTSDIRIAREITSFRPSRRGWHEIIAKRIGAATSDLDDLSVPDSLDLSTYRPDFKLKNILAADELIEDGSIAERVGRVGPSRRAGAAEMEGAGFAVACRDVEIPWLVMRGIADFGEPDRVKDWQFVATVAAASAVRLWLESCKFLDDKR
ncbi:hypothetical protein [Micromonospora sp. NPDC005087]|uniref:phosphorylase family protein n=1 Tax=Micromonospora sp. NPDC005087 TaxID=3364225 RepID=UPI0036B36090